MSCAVLAGGHSRRMGMDKAFLDVQGRPLIEWTLERLQGLGAEILVVTNLPERYAYLPVRVVSDILPERGALGGVYTALSCSTTERTLVVACDMPFLSRPLLRYQMVLSRDYDVVVPRLGPWLEPLHAVYSRACLEPIRGLIDRDGYRIYDFYADVRVRYVDKPEIDMLDPDGHSFVNVNTPADLDKVRRLAAARPRRGPAAG